MAEQQEAPEAPKRRRFGLGAVFLILVLLGGLGSFLPFVLSGFFLDQRETALAERFAALPNGQETALDTVVPGEWSDVCVLNSAIADPGKTRAPEPMAGMLIPPMRNHKVYLESGYWVIVALNPDRSIAGEYRVEPDTLANRTKDNGGNFCASRADARFRLETCDSGCARRIVFVRP